ncbi:MAG: hypothetical protein M1587_02390 [Thaumarchaeota archaeon]|nr:hypothetical protein [Nitrososphaerota archaeon]
MKGKPQLKELKSELKLRINEWNYWNKLYSKASRSKLAPSGLDRGGFIIFF